LQKLKDIKTNADTVVGRCLGKTFWYLSISRNALIVMITSAMAFYWIRDIDPSAFRLSGTVEPGIPDFQIPTFEIEVGNTQLSV
jgi:solute carrier family 26 (sodium-independent sulfate anion transporter), member 11